jgi:hypothetical protein
MNREQLTHVMRAASEIVDDRFGTQRREIDISQAAVREI